MPKKQLYCEGQPLYFGKAGWTIQWGMPLSLLFLVLLFILILSIPYQEVLRAEVVLNSKEPPVEVRSKVTGTVSEIFLSAGDLVKPGEIIGLIEQDGRLNDVNALKRWLHKKNQADDMDTFRLVNFEVGSDIQPFLSAYTKDLQKLRLFKSLGEDRTFEQYRRDQIQRAQRLIDKKEKEIEIEEQAMNLSLSNWQRNKHLFSRGIISQTDLENVEKEVLKQQNLSQRARMEIESLFADLEELQKDSFFKGNELQKEHEFFQGNLLLSRRELLVAIEKWEGRYLIKSPVEGRLSYLNVWGIHQAVQEGEVMFLISHTEGSSFTARGKIAAFNVGQLRRGDRAIFKLENYPHREWGTLSGSISHLPSPDVASKEKGYILFFDAIAPVTSFGKVLPTDQQMVGNVEIILKETSVLSRLFNGLNIPRNHERS